MYVQYIELLKDAVKQKYDRDTIINLLILIQIHFDRLDGHAEQVSLVDEIIDKVKTGKRMEDDMDLLVSTIQPPTPDLAEDPALIDDDMDHVVRMTPLTENERQHVYRIWRQGRDSDTIVDVSYSIRYPVLRKDLRTCMPGSWLNDAVINTYLIMLMRAAHRHNFIFSTYFMSSLYTDDQTYNYDRMRKWKRSQILKGSLFQNEKVLIPIHVNQDHWILAVVDMKQRKICTYDSLCATESVYIDILQRFLSDERKMENGEEIYWRIESNSRRVPRQDNGYDCGVFLLAFSYLLMNNMSINSVSQKDMPDIRQRIVFSISKQKIVW